MKGTLMIQRRRHLALALIAVLLCTACPNKGQPGTPRRNIVEGIDTYANSIDAVHQSVKELYRAGRITKEAATKYTKAIQQANTHGKNAAKILEVHFKNNPESQDVPQDVKNDLRILLDNADLILKSIGEATDNELLRTLAVAVQAASDLRKLL